MWFEVVLIAGLCYRIHAFDSPWKNVVFNTTYANSEYPSKLDIKKNSKALNVNDSFITSNATATSNNSKDVFNSHIEPKVLGDMYGMEGKNGIRHSEGKIEFKVEQIPLTPRHHGNKLSVDASSLSKGFPLRRQKKLKGRNWKGRGEDLRKTLGERGNGIAMNDPHSVRSVHPRSLNKQPAKTPGGEEPAAHSPPDKKSLTDSVAPWVWQRDHPSSAGEETFMTCVPGQRSNDKTINIAVLVPDLAPEHFTPCSRDQVMPAVELAVKHLREKELRGPLLGWNISVHYRDTNCSSTFGPLAAVDLYFQSKAGEPPLDFGHGPVLKGKP